MEGKVHPGAVNPEGPYSDEGRPPTGQPDNVIRLPREWLGPIGELVPIASTAAHEVPPVSAPAEPTELPLGASDFWGEASGVLQDVVASPPEPAPPPIAPAAPAPAVSGHAPAVGLRPAIAPAASRLLTVAPP